MSRSASSGFVTEGDEPPKPLSVGARVTVVSGADQGTSRELGRGLSVGSADENDLVLDDRRVSRRHVEVAPHPAGVEVRDLDSRNGTYVGGVRVRDVVVPPGSVVSIGDTDLLIEHDTREAEIPPSEREELGGMLGRSVAMRRLFTVIERVAPTDYTVLVEGETGTGKELVARALHQLSPRSEGPFVVIDCGAVTESLLESELFGHVKGAFTGAASAREGAFRKAHGGTLFIDELHSLSRPLQAKLLRALESRQVRPVGSDDEVEVDIRVVAATNHPLHEEVRAGHFREDLFYRMSVVRMSLPPLRERLEEVPALVEHFLRRAGFEGRVTGPTLGRLLGYGWPGNVRELRNTVERAVALAGSTDVPFDDLPFIIGEHADTVTWPLSLDQPYKEAKERLLETFERVYAAQLLERCDHNITEAARHAGLSRRHFFEIVKRHGLSSERDE